MGDILVRATLFRVWRGAPIWPWRVGHGSGFDRSPSAPQVCIMGFLALSPAQATRGAPFWPGRVGHGSVFDQSPSTSQVRKWVSLRPGFASSKRILTQQEVCRYGQGGSDRLDCSPSPSASKVRIVIPGVVLGHAHLERCAM